MKIKRIIDEKATPEYSAYNHMRQRCYNDNNKDYYNYGSRGIKVCDRWLESFDNFYEDMGERPSPNHSLDRINVNGNYTPDNCKRSEERRVGKESRYQTSWNKLYKEE